MQKMYRAGHRRALKLFWPLLSTSEASKAALAQIGVYLTNDRSWLFLLTFQGIAKNLLTIYWRLRVSLV